MPINTQTLTSPTGEYARDVTFMTPDKGDPKRLAVFLDAEIYLKMDATSMIDRLIDEQRIPPVACLFISHVENEQRHHDYPCNRDYADFVAQHAVDWACDRAPTLTPDRNLVCGVSLSGLAAAFIRLNHPQRFTHALCQSGSFWWEKEWLTEHLPSTGPGVYWISAGDKETQSDLTHAPTGMRQEVSQLDSVERFAEALKAAGNTVRHELGEGGHDPQRWKDELPEALQWILNTDVER